MPLLVHVLHYFLTNYSNIIQWLLFLIGLFLVIVPMYHGFINHSSFLKASELCKQRLGMHRFINLYYSNEKELPVPESTKNGPIDTNICLVSNKHDMNQPLLVPGLVNTGNSCFLNSVLQVKTVSFHVFTFHRELIINDKSLYLLYQSFKRIYTGSICCPHLQNYQ